MVGLMTEDSLFEKAYGRSPEIRVQAPGRINLIGEHVDYLEGCVMPAAIDRHLVMEAAAIDEPVIRAWSEGAADEPAEVALDDLVARPAGSDYWLNYIIGVVAGYREQGVAVPGFEVAIGSTLPSGAGLSSSAALETATALTIEKLTGVSREILERALICQQAEHQFAGVPCGIMDQLAVGAGRAGHAILVDCRDLTLRPVRMPENTVVVVADCGVKHALGDGEYRKRREDCEVALEILGSESWREMTLVEVEAKAGELGERLLRRARHAVTEIARVDAFAVALEAGDVANIASIMAAGHASLRDDFEVSCPELDLLVAAAAEFGTERGLFGSRMTGGGFGGSTVSIVHTDAAADLCAWLRNAFTGHFGRQINPFITVASDGAKIV